MKNISEIWKDAPELESYYEISNMGRLRNNKTKNIIVLHDNGKGYKNFRICNQKICKTFRIHRLVMLAFSPIENPENYTVHHKDFNPGNNQLENLEWISLEENMKISRKEGRYDQANKGHSIRMKKLTEEGKNYLIEFNRINCGEKSVTSKLKESEVLEIRDRMISGERSIDVGKDYNVCRQTIEAIHKKKIWKHL